MEEAADHCAHRKGDEGRSGPVPRRRRQRLHRQAARRGEAVVSGPGVDAEIRAVTVPGANFDIELQLLIDAIYLRFHYDFRDYATSSLKRRLRTAMGRFDCRSLSQLQDKVLHDPEVFPALLDYLTVPVSEMFRDPSYFRALRQAVVPVLRTYPSLKI